MEKHQGPENPRCRGPLGSAVGVNGNGETQKGPGKTQPDKNGDGGNDDNGGDDKQTVKQRQRETPRPENQETQKDQRAGSEAMGITGGQENPKQRR